MSSFIPLQRKFGLIYSSLYHSLCLVSNMCKFQFEIEKLKEILLSNDYFDKFIDMCISKCMNKLNIKKWLIIHCLTDCNNKNDDRIINNNNSNNNNNNNNNNKVGTRVGTRNGVGKLKRKTRVGFRIRSTQNRNGEKTWLDPRGQSKEKNMDLWHDMPSTAEHWG